MPTFIGGFEIVTSNVYLTSTNFVFGEKGRYLIIFNASTLLPGYMDVTYHFCKNNQQIEGAFISVKSHHRGIFPTSLSFVEYFNEGDELDIEIIIVSGMITDTIEIQNTILNIIKIYE